MPWLYINIFILLSFQIYFSDVLRINFTYLIVPLTAWMCLHFKKDGLLASIIGMTLLPFYLTQNQLSIKLGSDFDVLIASIITGWLIVDNNYSIFIDWFRVNYKHLVWLLLFIPISIEMKFEIFSFQVNLYRVVPVVIFLFGFFQTRFKVILKYSIVVLFISYFVTAIFPYLNNLGWANLSFYFHSYRIGDLIVWSFCWLAGINCKYSLEGRQQIFNNRKSLIVCVAILGLFFSFISLNFIFSLPIIGYQTLKLSGYSLAAIPLGFLTTLYFGTKGLVLIVGVLGFVISNLQHLFFECYQGPYEFAYFDLFIRQLFGSIDFWLLIVGFGVVALEIRALSDKLAKSQN